VVDLVVDLVLQMVLPEAARVAPMAGEEVDFGLEWVACSGRRQAVDQDAVAVAQYVSFGPVIHVAPQVLV
jgi:hypothetical protein